MKSDICIDIQTIIFIIVSSVDYVSDLSFSLYNDKLIKTGHYQSFFVTTTKQRYSNLQLCKTTVANPHIVEAISR